MATWSGATSKINAPQRVSEVHVDGLAMLKLVKHCRDALPKMVAGSLLGLDKGSILEVTHCFPFPAPYDKDEHADGIDITDASIDMNLDGEEYQMEMMKMLREVNVDNNCVGWYKSIYVGSFCQTPLVETQVSYQENLSDNCVVLLYDPVATCTATLNVKAYQLSEQFITSYRAKSNEFLPPSSILIELPLKIRNPGLITGYVFDISGTRFPADQLGWKVFAAGDAAPLESYLEHCCQWVDDLVEEQSKFQTYLRNIERYKDQIRWQSKRKNEIDHEDVEALTWKNITLPPRLDSLLITNQIRQYCAKIGTQSMRAFSTLHLSNVNRP
jgi:translation initiation factor 3 subunit H